MCKFISVAEDICKSLNFSSPEYLGKGQYKEAFRAENHEGTIVALKVFDPAKCNLDRAEREIRAMLQCNSQFIGRIFKWETHRSSESTDFLYTVEEFLGGGTLTSRMQALRGNVTDVLEIGIDLLQGISHLRSHKLVHRDIKPDNIMFRDENRTPVLVDFGIVRDLSGNSLTLSHLHQGPCSPYFASPEQLNNNKVLIDWRSDQFALGVVIALSIIGIHPYGDRSTTPPDTVAHVMSRGPHSSEFLREIQRLGIVCLRTMTSQWPVDRFSSPGQIISEFQSIIER